MKHAPGRIACPCCGFLTLSARAAYEICDVCRWEDDGQDDADAAEVRGGPNGHLSLSEGRENFTHYAACSPEFIPDARPPLPTEIPEP